MSQSTELPIGKGILTASAQYIPLLFTEDKIISNLRTMMHDAGGLGTSEKYAIACEV